MHLIHPKPLDGEALTSWLVRTGEARGLLLHILTQQLAGEVAFWTRDGDLLAPPALLQGVARSNGVSLSRAAQSCLGSFEGILDDHISGTSQSPMIRPLGVYHRTRRGFGQQACPHCLREDQPYFRLNWRLRLVTCCTVHGCVLIEACPSCAAPIVPHRGGLVNCDQCGVHLGDCEPAFADNRVLQLQTEIERVLMGKAVMWPFLMGMPPILFFRLLMQLLRALSSKSWGRRLRAEVEKYIGPITLDYTDKVGHLRFLSTQSTHQGLRGVELLLQGWPAMFAGICQDARAWATWIMPEEYSDQCPFTLRTALDTYLRPGSSNKLR